MPFDAAAVAACCFKYVVKTREQPLTNFFFWNIKTTNIHSLTLPTLKSLRINRVQSFYVNCVFFLWFTLHKELVLHRNTHHYVPRNNKIKSWKTWVKLYKVISNRVKEVKVLFNFRKNTKIKERILNRIFRQNCIKRSRFQLIICAIHCYTLLLLIIFFSSNLLSINKTKKKK